MSTSSTDSTDYETLASSKFFAEALDRGDIIGTERVVD